MVLKVVFDEEFAGFAGFWCVRYFFGLMIWGFGGSFACLGVFFCGLGGNQEMCLVLGYFLLSQYFFDGSAMHGDEFAVLGVGLLFVKLLFSFSYRL